MKSPFVFELCGLKFKETFFTGGLAIGLLNGSINFSGLDGILGLLFLVPAAILSLKAAADNLKILRLLKENRRRFEK